MDNPLRLNDSYSNETLQQLASQLEHVEPKVCTIIRGMIRDDKTLDFDEGVLAGMAAAFQLSSMTDGRTIHGSALAIFARYILNRRAEEME